MTRHVDSERLSAWISGELGERDAPVIRAHVAACPTCAAMEATLRGQILTLRALDRPEPPPTLWAAIEGQLDTSDRHSWSWRSLLLGALAGAAVVSLAVVAVWGILGNRGAPGALVDRSGGVLGPGEGARVLTGGAEIPEPAADPLVAEAERELDRAAIAYEGAINRLRVILDREQARWDPEARVRVAERLAGLDDAIAHSRTVARRVPGDSAGADLLFSAYQRQIDFLAEAVHRGSPSREGLR